MNQITRPDYKTRSMAGLILEPKRRKNSFTCIRLTETERLFILYRLKAVTSVVEAILHPIVPTKHLPDFDRKQLVGLAWTMIHCIQQNPWVLVLTPASVALLREAIAGNTYFVRPYDDPLMNADAINLADALRRKVEIALNIRIRKFKI